MYFFKAPFHIFSTSSSISLFEISLGQFADDCRRFIRFLPDKLLEWSSQPEACKALFMKILSLFLKGFLCICDVVWLVFLSVFCVSSVFPGRIYLKLFLLLFLFRPRPVQWNVIVMSLVFVRRRKREIIVDCSLALHTPWYLFTLLLSLQSGSMFLTLAQIWQRDAAGRLYLARQSNQHTNYKWQQCLLKHDSFI